MNNDYYILNEKNDKQINSKQINEKINEKISDNIKEKISDNIKENNCDSNVKEEENIECLICFEEINLDNHIYCKTCKNVYHKKCLDQWFKKTNNNVCTYCQQPTLCKHKNNFKILKKCFMSIFS